MYHFIVNPNSRTGKGIKIWYRVKYELDFLEVPYICHMTEYKFHATELTRDICNQNTGIKNIVVLGGDGTVNEVINGISDYDEVILGYIPSGSSNDLARSLKISTDPIISLKHILSPSEFKYVDTGIIKIKDINIERRFAVSTGMGFDAAICKVALESKIKKVLNKIGLGKLTYSTIAVKQLFVSPFLEGTFIVDGTLTKSYKNILMAAVMIHKYEGGGIKFAPNANPYDGKLSVCIIHCKTRIRALQIMIAMLIGKHEQLKEVDIFDCDTLNVTLHNPSIIHVDGEYPGSFRHTEISCTEKKLRIII